MSLGAFCFPPPPLRHSSHGTGRPCGPWWKPSVPEATTAASPTRPRKTSPPAVLRASRGGLGRRRLPCRTVGRQRSAEGVNPVADLSPPVIFLSFACPCVQRPRRPIVLCELRHPPVFRPRGVAGDEFQSRSIPGLTWPRLVEMGPTSVFRAKLVDVGRVCPQIGHMWPELGRCGRVSASSWPSGRSTYLARFGNRLAL